MSGAYPNCSMCGEDLIPHDGELCGACAKAVSETAKEMIAAAEERGRRRGIEEAMDLLAEAREHLQAFWRMVGSKPSALAARLDRYLAPRDSGPKHKDWCALFDNPEAGKSCDCDGDRK